MIKIAVIVTVYNRSESLHKCLESVANQKRAADEVLVIDDGSDPKHLDDVKAICDEFTEVKLNTLSQNKGVSAARNIGLEKVQSEFVIFLDDDDQLLPNAIPSAHHSLDKQPETQVLVRRSRLVNAGSFWKKHYEQISIKMAHRPIAHTHWFFQFAPALHSMVFSTDLIRNIRFDEQLNYGEDRILGIKLKARNAQFTIADEEVGIYQVSSTQADPTDQLQFADYILGQNLYDDQSQKSYLMLFKALILWRAGQGVKTLNCLLKAMNQPHQVLYHFYLWLRK